ARRVRDRQRAGQRDAGLGVRVDDLLLVVREGRTRGLWAMDLGEFVDAAQLEREARPTLTKVPADGLDVRVDATLVLRAGGRDREAEHIAFDDRFSDRDPAGVLVGAVHRGDVPTIA